MLHLWSNFTFLLTSPRSHKQLDNVLMYCISASLQSSLAPFWNEMKWANKLLMEKKETYSTFLYLKQYGTSNTNNV